jgi:uncharacterized protein (TIGR00288 family)
MQVAVLIDADNIPASHASKVFAAASSLGTLSVRRAYGKGGAARDWSEAASDALCEIRVQASVGPSKNGTDIALAVDAMDILYNHAPDAFCIVSNDRDFVPLANRLRAAGKLVHSICRLADERYKKAFDSVVELEPVEPIAPIDPVVDAFKQITATGPSELSLAVAGAVLRKRLPGVIPPGGKALRRVLENSGKFAILGTGLKTSVRLVA